MINNYIHQNKYKKYDKNEFVIEQVLPIHLDNHVEKDNNNNGISSDHMDPKVLLFHQEDFVHLMEFLWFSRHSAHSPIVKFH